jgi:S-adenosylmethionine:tRNA ribosyltransferase-isomerase
MGRAGVAAFELPAVRHATEPPEARGLRRDEVRLLVSHLDPADSTFPVGPLGPVGRVGRVGRADVAVRHDPAVRADRRNPADRGNPAEPIGLDDRGLEHLRFNELPRLLRAGDLLVVNASGTLNASLTATRPNGMRVELHLSTELPGGLRTVEVRAIGASGTQPLREALAGETLHLPACGHATLLAPYPYTGDLAEPSRLWAAVLELPMPLGSYLERFGAPIRYGYVPRAWPSDAYQTVFATEMGSAEMPSAGRPFTRDLVANLFAAGVAIAPIVLHTGVSSLEDHEPPYEERFCVPRQTADRVNRAHAGGHRVIAVGTTVVRALETVTDDTHVTHPGEGWTNFIVTPDYALRAVDGLLTGLHEPRATHLAIIQAVARRTLAAADARNAIDRAYRGALDREYLWHEFGDTPLILPARV